MDELIGNLQTYELSKTQENSKRKGREDMSLGLKASPNDLSKDDDEISYLARRYHKIVEKNMEDF